ncbi:cellulose-binding protein, partial [Lentzea aerocolonigenes]
MAAIAVALTTAATISGALPAAAAAGCKVDYQVTNEWQGGFIASVNVTNLGDAVTSWRLTWSFGGGGQTVGQIWNGTVRQSGAQVTVDNAGYNGSLGTGSSAGLGFVANGPTTPVPTDFALNGTACTGSVPAPDVLAQAHTAGRVTKQAQYSWPGVYFEGRFRGTGVGVSLNDSVNEYDVQVDGATVATLLKPGRTTYWVNNLSNADHAVRLVKRTESPWAAGEFGGFVAASGGTVLAKPAARSRQIEFIGDSLTAGYGNLSTTRDCSTNGGVDRNTNTDISFGALTSRAL